MQKTRTTIDKNDSFAPKSIESHVCIYAYRVSEIFSLIYLFDLQCVCWVHCTCTAAQGWRFGAAKQLSKLQSNTGHGIRDMGKSQGQEDEFHADLACRLSCQHPTATLHPVSAAISHLAASLCPLPALT